MLVRGLYVIINRHSQEPDVLIRLCEQVIQGGADVIQYRDKNSTSQDSIQIAIELSTLCHTFEVPFIINDNTDLAGHVNADGIHIGQNDISVKEARRILGDNFSIGVTVSNVQEAKLAELEGADYLGCGHIYQTTTKKKTTPPIGLRGLKQVIDTVPIPVIAIGGITFERIPDVLATGVSGVAMISAIDKHSDPVRACREIKKIISHRGTCEV